MTIQLRDHPRVKDKFDKIVLDLHVRAGRRRQLSRLLPDRPQYAEAGRARSPSFDRAALGGIRRLKEKKTQAVIAAVRYIFPGGELDHLGMSIAILERYGFEVVSRGLARALRAHRPRPRTTACSANRAAAERDVGSAKTRLRTLDPGLSSITFARGNYGTFQKLSLQTYTQALRPAAVAHPPQSSDSYFRPAPLKMGYIHLRTTGCSRERNRRGLGSASPSHKKGDGAPPARHLVRALRRRAAPGIRRHSPYGVDRGTRQVPKNLAQPRAALPGTRTLLILSQSKPSSSQGGPSAARAGPRGRPSARLLGAPVRTAPRSAI